LPAIVTDEPDIEALAKKTKISSVDGMLKCHRMFYPEKQLGEQTMEMIKGVAARIRASRRRSGEVL
jgi:hypothetical protein